MSLYVAPGIGAVPALMARVQSRLRALPPVSLPKALPTTGMFVRRAVTVSRAAPPSRIVTPAARFAVAPTPVRAPAPSILKRPPMATAMRPAMPSILRGTVLERVGLRPPPKPVGAIRPTSPFSIVQAAAARFRGKPTASPIPGSMLDRLRRKAMEPKVPRPGSLVARLQEKARAKGKPLPRSMFGRLAARARPAIIPPRAAVSPAIVPYDAAPLVPAMAPAAESPFFTIEDLMAPPGPEKFTDEAGTFTDEAPEPMFGDLDFDVALQEDAQSELPSWLEGAEDVALLEPDAEEVPDELLSLATLDRGLGQGPGMLLALRAAGQAPPEPQRGINPLFLTAAAVLVALYAIQSSGRPRGPRGGGKASWE